jgi:hypothetical protein
MAERLFYFYKLTNDYTVESINFLLNSFIREHLGRVNTPSLGCVDSQSIKIAPMIFEDNGIDGNKKINGPKRQFMVDANDLVCASRYMRQTYPIRKWVESYSKK